MRLLIDIETSPMIAEVWGMYDQNLSWDMISKHTEVLCWTAIDLDTGKCYQDSQHLHKTNHEMRVVRSLFKLFDAADVLIAHNGDRFDIPMMTARFVKYGLGRPSPYKTIDTLKVARSHFKFPSNRLDHLADFLGVARKNKMNYSDWKGCLQGDIKAFRKMLAYNKKDVLVLKQVYQKLLPWIKQPVVTHGCACPACNSKKIRARGYTVNQCGRYQRYQCQSCGSWFQDRYKYKHDSRKARVKSI